MCGVLIPSPCIKTTSKPFTIKVRRPHVSVFPTFSSNKCWWRLRAPSSLGRRTREPRVALLSKGRLRQGNTQVSEVNDVAECRGSNQAYLGMTKRRCLGSLTARPPIHLRLVWSCPHPLLPLSSHCQHLILRLPFLLGAASSLGLPE